MGDFVKYPELMWLNRYYLIPPFLLALGVMALGAIIEGGGITAFFSVYGFSALFIGFFLSTVITYHGTFSINSIMHKFGNQRYNTGDESKNSLWLALLTLGEGWHNNHHYYEVASRQGFFWWEVDITYYGLKVLSWFGLIWDLKGVPEHIRLSRDKKHAQELRRHFEAQRPAVASKEKTKTEDEDVPVY